MSDYSYLDDLTNAELQALRVKTIADIAGFTQDVNDATTARNLADQAAVTAESNYDNEVINQYAPPSVSGETNVDEGGPVIELIAVDIPISIVTRTGNGDDGIGIVFDWSIPVEAKFNSNLQIYVSGEKVDESASLITTINGSIPSFGDSLLSNEAGIIVPDLFDPEAERNPDQTFVVMTGAQTPLKTYGVSVFAKSPDQTYNVETGPETPDQIFAITSIQTYGVSAAEPPFIVKVFAKPADQVFSVISSAVPADKTFTVTRGPNTPDFTLNLSVIDRFGVTTGFSPPDKSFFVEVKAAPAPTPDQTFDVSIGGPDAPPIPTPLQTFSVETGPAIPNVIHSVKTIQAFAVKAAPAPFLITVGAEQPDQIFQVQALAKAFDQSFAVSVGADVPSQIFETKVIDTRAVAVYQSPKFYSVQENNSPAYVVTGEGLSFAVEPTIGLYVGQKLNFALSVPANAMRIKNVQAAGAGVDPTSFGALVTRNGAISGNLTAQFFQPGTYYYQSEFDAGVFGQIDVFGTQPGAPDQTFTVTTMAEPADQTFAVTVGASTPDITHVVKTGEVFEVTVGANTPTQTYGVTVFAANSTQTFAVTVDEPLLEYTVANSGSGDYSISGEGLTNSLDPSLTAVIGQPIEFTLNASGHPFWIGDTNTTGAGVSSAAWADELVNNGIASGGVIRVRFNAAGVYHYNCEYHGSMHGTITVS